MPAEEEQQNHPDTKDGQQKSTSQSDSLFVESGSREEPETEQKSHEIITHRAEHDDGSEKREPSRLESQAPSHAEQQELERRLTPGTFDQRPETTVSTATEETIARDSLSSAQKSSSTLLAVDDQTTEASCPVKSSPVDNATIARERVGSIGGRQVPSSVDEEDDEDDDDEEEPADNEEQEEQRGRSRDDGYNNEEERPVHGTHHGQQNHSRQNQSQTPTGGQYYDDDEEDEEDEGEERSELRQLFEPINDSQAQSEDEEDGDYIPDEEVKKTIMVGSDFQAVIPEGLCRYDDALPYENEDKLLWNPTILNEQEIVDYLVKITSPTSLGTTVTAAGGGGTATAAPGGGVQQQQPPQQQQQQQQQSQSQSQLHKNSTNSGSGTDLQTNSVYAIPLGNHLRDDEQSLYLLQQCGHNIDEALRRRRISNNTVPVPDQQMSIWSEEECRNFENGLRVHGKDFHMIQQTKVRTRSVGELVQFYYLWKKTERHDLFASKARLEKKKYNLHPGLTDHMDRFLEEQENSTGFGDRSSSPGFSTLYSSASEAKRQRLLDSKENNSTGSSKRGAASNL